MTNRHHGKRAVTIVCAAGLLWCTAPRAEDSRSTYSESIQSIRRKLETELKGHELNLKIGLPRVSIFGKVHGTPGRSSRAPATIVAGAPGQRAIVIPGKSTEIQAGTRDISGFLLAESVSQPLAVNADTHEPFVYPDSALRGSVDRSSGIPPKCETKIRSVRAPENWPHPALVLRLTSKVTAVKASTLSANLDRLSPRSQPRAQEILGRGKGLTVLGCVGHKLDESLSEIAEVAGVRKQIRGELIFLLPDEPFEAPTATIARMWSLAFRDHVPAALTSDVGDEAGR